MIKIKIITLGHIKHRLDVERLTRWRSSIFKITTVDSVPELPDGEYDWQHFGDSELSFIQPSKDVDITFAITEYSLQDNFYLRRLDKNIVVLSLYQTADACEWNDIPLENFLLRNLYELCAIFKLEGSVPTSGIIPPIIHDDTRHCIFDMCGIKTDVVYSASLPKICDQCRSHMNSKQMTTGFVKSLEEELKRIKKPLYYRILSFVKRRPVWSIGITFAAGVFVELFSNLLYDLISWIFKI